MFKPDVVLIATPHAHFGNGLGAIVRSVDSSIAVLHSQDYETASHLLRTNQFAFLIVDALFLQCLSQEADASRCLVLVHTADQERDALTRLVQNIVYSDMTTQALTDRLQNWLDQ